MYNVFSDFLCGCCSTGADSRSLFMDFSYSFRHILWVKVFNRDM